MTAATVTSSARSSVQAHPSAGATMPAGISTRMRPLGDHVVVQPTGRGEMTKSAIVLPDTPAEKPQEGSIIAVGPVPEPAALQEPTSGYDRRTT